MAGVVLGALLGLVGGIWAAVAIGIVGGVVAYVGAVIREATPSDKGTPLGNNFGRAWERVLRAADDGAGDLGTWGEEPAKPKSGPTPSREFVPRFSPYVLRHTCATLLLLLGVDLLTVSRRLRHKNIAITARFYGHIKAKDTSARLKRLTGYLQRVVRSSFRRASQYQCCPRSLRATTVFPVI